MTATVTHPDTRPRITYRLPDGELVKIIHDHGQIPTETITFTLKGGEIVDATLVRRSVKVRYKRTSVTAGSSAGWSYDVLAADSLTWIGGGWSAGRKSDAVSEFQRMAAEKAWSTR